MTIRLTENVKHPQVADSNVGGYIVHGQLGGRLVITDTLEEALAAKRAFENVLAPRFTRDEAIAIVKARYIAPDGSDETWRAYMRGIRLALVALADAGVFVDRPEDACDRNALTMSELLDAAGIR